MNTNFRNPLAPAALTVLFVSIRVDLVVNAAERVVQESISVTAAST